MKEIICRTQKELDAAVKLKDVEIIIRDTTEWVSVSGNATIQSVSDNATIQYVSDNATIQYVYDNATIQSVSGNATIKYVYDNATIQSVYDNATIQSVSGNATIKYVYDNATIKSVYSNATIKYVYDNATIQSVYSNATIQSVSGNATIQSVSGNATIQVYSEQVTIESCCLMAVIIMIGCVCEIKNKTKTVTVIKNKVATYNKKSFCQIYQENMIDKTTIKLYKSVRKDNHKDFYTNSIEYKGEVTCPDFKENKEQECGNGFHLSPLPHLALSYNDGLLLECAVKLWDFVVYPQNITKVRCQKVTVLGEYKK